jgi:hypothetical protein
MARFEDASHVTINHCIINQAQGQQTNITTNGELYALDQADPQLNPTGFHHDRRIIVDWLSPLNFKVTQSDVYSK